jgi:hypothetical protein
LATNPVQEVTLTRMNSGKKDGADDQS